MRYNELDLYIDIRTGHEETYAQLKKNAGCMMPYLMRDIDEEIEMGDLVHVDNYTPAHYIGA